jgi:Tol biopolymer transport system component
VILFSPTMIAPLFRVAASGGGEAIPVTTLDRQTSHRLPQFLPGGRQFLFFALGTPQTGGIYIGSVDSKETKRLTASDAAGVYMPPGWLLWMRNGTLFAQRLDLAKLALSGEPVRVADPVRIDGFTYASAVSASATGLLAYKSGTPVQSQLTWFDRSGKALGILGAPDSNILWPRLSPDGRRVAVAQGNFDIWLMDGAHTTRFTSDASVDAYATWSPDGSRVVFTSNRKGHYDLYQKSSGGASSEELLLESTQDKVPADWSPDGRFLLYLTLDPQTDWDLWVLPMEGDRKPWPFLKTNFRDGAGVFSPDGRWVAYLSYQSGRSQVYIRPFLLPATAGAVDRSVREWQVSTSGGMHPRWSPDGKELYYIAPDGKLMAAAINVDGATLDPGAPRALFQTRIYGGGVDSQQGRQYDVSRDGRFLINTVLEDNNAAPITLLQNWKPPAK